jgi:hypothetical protein
VLEVLAGLHAPRDDYHRTTRAWIRVFDVTAGPWSELPLASFTEGGRSDPSRSYLVVAQVGCTDVAPDYYFFGHGMTWYLLPLNRLWAYEHGEFGMLCRPSPLARFPTDLSPEYGACLDRFVAGMVRADFDPAALGCGPVPATPPPGGGPLP